MKHPVIRRDGEKGFALLIVFLMAAAIALMLYQQMPRVAFESERDKEQLLIDRGEQYKRAIQLYVVANKKYPARVEDLENTNDKRYLRKRYVDPFTGKKEWRLVHTNGALLTDSLVQKPPTADGKSGDVNAGLNNPGNSGAASTGATNPDGTPVTPQVNAAVLQRPSDRTLPTGIPGQFGGTFQTGDPNQQQQQFPPITLTQQFPPITLGPLGPNGQPLPSQPGQLPGQVPGQFPGQFQGQPNQPGQIPGQFNPNGFNPAQGGQYPVQPGDPNAIQPGQFQPGQFQPGQFQPGQGQQGPGAPNPFGDKLPVGPQGQPQFPGVVQQAQAGFPQGAGAATTNNAVNLINQILTQPRQPPPGIVTPQQNNSLGAGIAGVASTYTGPSVKAYNTRTKFNEWEFVFQNQQQTTAGPAAPTGQPGQTPQPGVTPTDPSVSPFGLSGPGTPQGLGAGR